MEPCSFCGGTEPTRWQEIGGIGDVAETVWICESCIDAAIILFARRDLGPEGVRRGDGRPWIYPGWEWVETHG